MRLALRRYKALWKRFTFRREEEFDEAEWDQVHLKWISRFVKHLQDELTILSTTDRSRQYLTTVQAFKIEVPQT
jgi:hypothetical protein